MADQSGAELSVAVADIPTGTVSVLETGSDLQGSVADPLPPPDSTAVGCDAVEEAVRSARRVTVYQTREEIGPVQVSRVHVRRVLDAARRSPDPVMVTARFEGPDLVVRTLELVPPKVLEKLARS